MDNRVRALLEPKRFAKDAKTSSTKDENARSSVKSSPSIKHSNDNKPLSQPSSSTTRSVPIYDPKRLLDPRGSRKPTKTEPKNPYLNSLHADSSPQIDVSMDTSGKESSFQSQRESSGSRSMIEDLYGVQKRVEPPAKRFKLDSDQEGVKSNSRNGNTQHHGSGIVGEYMRPNEEEQGPTTDHRKIVDLTNDDDANESDDDLKVVKARNVSNEQEVCYGRLMGNVHAHAVPKSRPYSNPYGDSNQWPITKCIAVRVMSRNSIIDVKDPFDHKFGRIEPDLANVLTPLVDNLKKFRLVVILMPRKKKDHEIAHQACSQTLAASINVYGRRADVEKVGKILGSRNIWLRGAILIDKGYEEVNPHTSRMKDVIPQLRHKNTPYFESRTVEEATEAVTKLFDHYANSERPLEETDADSIILTPLLSHQKQALTFMIQREHPRTFGELESENSSLWRRKRKGNGLIYYEEIVTGITLKEEPDEVYGGLLADVMGLGKTIEALSLIAGTTDAAEHFGSQRLTRADEAESVLMTQSKATLIVAPVSTVKNWEDQINEHIRPGSLNYYVYHGSNRERNPYKLAQHDIIISTYSTIATECSSKSQDPSPIKSIRWFRIILDEAHTIRESRASQSQAMYNLFAQRRWCLTGTPIQNRLDDLGSLTRFLRLYPYDTTMRFNQYVRSPAQSGDSNYLKSLRVFIDSFTLRRLRDRVDLPDRKELVERLDSSPDERKLHDFFKERAHVQIKAMAEEETHRTVSQHHVLRAIMTLRLICDHGRELLKEEDLEAVKGNSQTEAIDIDADIEHHPPTITPRTAYENLALLAEADLDLCKQCDKKIGGDLSGAEADAIDDVRGYMLPCYDLLCAMCFELEKGAIDDMNEGQTLDCPWCQLHMKAQYIPIPKTTAELLDWAPEETLNESSEAYKKGTYTGPSTKVKALLDDLNEIKQESGELMAQGEPPLKSVVFSEFTSNLDLIERGLDDHGFGKQYVRIDGTMSLNKRKAVLDSLNGDDEVTILLASIKAAGQGLNLTAASRAFIMEPMWNPAAEAQAVDRIYRIGQKRRVVVKRYQINNSIEGKIIELQKKKQALADVSMNKNHQLLNKKESREAHMKDILALFK